MSNPNQKKAQQHMHSQQEALAGNTGSNIVIMTDKEEKKKANDVQDMHNEAKMHEADGK